MKIEFQKISKEYKNGVWGLKDVDFSIEYGVFGLLAPNGAGKTTLMRILSTLLKPTSGTCVVNGQDISKNGDSIRKILGYLPQELSMYKNLTVFEFVHYMAILKGYRSKSVIDNVLEEVGLLDIKNRKVASLSGGMKRRVGIAQAIIGNPQILIFDEPTAGLDPEERVRFRNLISKFARDRIVILSTHIIEDVYQTCENICILKSGSVLYQGDKTNLMKGVYGKVKLITVENEQELEEIKKKVKIISASYQSNGIITRVIDENAEYKCIPEKESMEDAYVYYVGGGYYNERCPVNRKI